MTKNIIIAVLLLTITGFLLFATNKSQEARKNLVQAEEAMQEASRNAEEASRQRKLAIEAAARATRAHAEFVKQSTLLEECKSK